MSTRTPTRELLSGLGLPRIRARRRARNPLACGLHYREPQFDQSKRAYGSPRIYDELKEKKVTIGRNRVIRLMRAQNLVARQKKRVRKPAMPEGEQLVAANLLARDFAADAPNRRWVGDTTELRAGGLRVFLAAVLDLYSRFIVGCAVSLVNDRHLIERALKMGLKRRCPEAGLLHHSDQGSPYTSEDYQKLLAGRGITCSMSRRGDCYDNAVMESWFSTLKFELGETFDSPAEAKEDLFDYIEVFYNSVPQCFTFLCRRNVENQLRWRRYRGVCAGLAREPSSVEIRSLKDPRPVGKRVTRRDLATLGSET